MFSEIVANIYITPCYALSELPRMSLQAFLTKPIIIYSSLELEFDSHFQIGLSFSHSE